ncbi:MAG: hypothetical protein R3A13_03855 [Bdellovibrionota bacterium]
MVFAADSPEDRLLNVSGNGNFTKLNPPEGLFYDPVIIDNKIWYDCGILCPQLCSYNLNSQTRTVGKKIASSRCTEQVPRYLSLTADGSDLWYTMLNEKIIGKIESNGTETIYDVDFKPDLIKADPSRNAVWFTFYQEGSLNNGIFAGKINTNTEEILYVRFTRSQYFPCGAKKGILIDKNGNFFCSEDDDSRILKVTPEGKGTSILLDQITRHSSPAYTNLMEDPINGTLWAINRNYDPVIDGNGVGGDTSTLVHFANIDYNENLTFSWQKIARRRKILRTRILAQNTGNAVAERRRLFIYRSDDTTLDFTDKRVKRFIMPRIRQNKRKTFKVNFKRSRKFQNKYLILCEDCTKGVTPNSSNTHYVSELIQ